MKWDENENWFGRHTLANYAPDTHVRMYFCINLPCWDAEEVLEVSELEEKYGKGTKTPKQTPQTRFAALHDDSCIDDTLAFKNLLQRKCKHVWRSQKNIFCVFPETVNRSWIGFCLVSACSDVLTIATLIFFLNICNKTILKRSNALKIALFEIISLNSK